MIRRILTLCAYYIDKFFLKIYNISIYKVWLLQKTERLNHRRDYMSLSIMPPRLNLKSDATSSSFTLSGVRNYSWTVTSNASWCTVTRASNTSIKVSVTKNTGVERTATITVKHDTDTVTVTVTQNKSVYYQRDMILFSLQETSDGCAITCAAMCMKKTLKQFQEEGLPTCIKKLQRQSRRYFFR